MSCLSILGIVTASLITVTSSSPALASVTYGTISGTVTAGGAPVPPGTVQVVFVKYKKRPSPTQPSFRPCVDGQPDPPVVRLVVTPTGANGFFSQSLDTDYYYKIIFKPLTTAPRSAFYRWYAASIPSGTTMGYNSDLAIPQATCITTLSSAGLTNINLATDGSRIQVTGSLTTSSGVPVSESGALISIVRRPTCFYSIPDGYTTRPNELGQWEMAGTDQNQLNQ